MKKGFTLLEILVVISILSIVMTIAIPNMHNYLVTSYQRAYELDLKSLQNAAKEYALRKSIKLSNGSQKIITISQMVSANIIDEVRDPKTKEICDGYVIATRNNNNYTYSPYLKCGENYLSDDYGNTNINLPVITIIGSNPVNINVGDSYSDAGATAVDYQNNSITSSIVITSSVNMTIPGTYNITYSVKDDLGNENIARRIVNVVDNTIPTITFTPNNNTTYAKSRSLVIKVSDIGGLDNNSLKYVWTTSTTQPATTDFTLLYKSNEAIKTPSNVSGIYYLWAMAIDIEGNTTVKNSGPFYIDNIPPSILTNGSNPTNINVGSTYSDAGATATDDIDGDVTNRISIASDVNPSVIGTYNVTYTATDSSNNAGIATRTVNVIDNVLPTVAFGTNGNITYAKSRSTTVTVSDAHTGVNTSSLKYQWTTSTTAPSEASFSSSFTNGSTISTPAGVTGGYYLWILAKDIAGNTTITRTNVFNLDNTKPIITMNGNATVTINKGSTYSDAGATATDANSGINGSVTATGTVNPSIVGSYTITYSVADKAGNTATPVTRTVNVIDVLAPVITLNGSNPTIIYVGSTYSDAGATAVDDVDGNVTSKIVITGTVNPTVAGSYTITYTVSDTAGNEAIVTRTVNVIDDSNPTVAFGTNGNSTYAKNGSTTVTVSDTYSGVNTSSLKYQWTTSTTAPSEASFSSSFTNGSTISTPAGVTGGYYLWILAKDKTGNTTIIRTNVFNLDNTVPIIATTTNSNISLPFSSWTLSSGAYVDGGGNLVLPSTGAFAVSQYLPVTATTWLVTFNGYTTSASPQYTPNGGVLFGSSYYDANYTSAVSQNTYSSNGYAPSFTLGSTGSGSWDGWGGYGPNVYYVILRAYADGNYGVPPITLSNIAFTSYGNTNLSKTINVSFSDTSGINLKKWLAGTKTVSDFESSGTSFTNSITVTSNGTYTIYAEDNAGNATINVVTISGIDRVAPTVSFGTNGNSTYAKNGSTTVTVNDDYIGLNTISLKYQWTMSTTAPSEASFSSTFTNGSTINTPAGVTGGYYLWILAKDNVGNTTITKTNVFNLDNTAPVITLNGTNPTAVEMGGVYSDAGATATDANSGINGSVTATGTVNPSIAGSYTVTYTVSDKAGNIATLARTVNVADTTPPSITTTLAGSIIYTDPTFASGINSTHIYNNTGDGTVAVTRTAISDAPEGSGYGLTITTNSSTSTPGWGGFYFATPTSANKTFVTRIVAKIPVGYNINFASNAYGTGGTYSWLTSTAGTGGYQEYICQVNTGSTGTFSSTNFFYLYGGATPTTSNPLTWYVAYATVLDTTRWGTSNSMILRASDTGTGIVGYGMNQSSTTAPTFTTILSDNEIGKVINAIAANGTYYVWTKDASGNLSNKSLTVSYVDTTIPTYSSYEIKNITSSGYDVYVYGVSDAGSGINRVQFPTWTDTNGQDDIQSNWPTNAIATGTNQGGGTWYYRVDKSSHNNEAGQYYTHIYIYDNVGNTNSFSTTGANVPSSTVTCAEGVANCTKYSRTSSCSCTAGLCSGYCCDYTTDYYYTYNNITVLNNQAACENACDLACTAVTTYDTMTYNCSGPDTCYHACGAQTIYYCPGYLQ